MILPDLNQHDPIGKPLTLLILHRGGDQIRGSEEALLTLLEGLDRGRFRAIVFCSSRTFAESVTALGVQCEVADFPEIILGSDEMRLPALRYLRALRNLVAVCKRESVRLVMASGGGPCQLLVPLSHIANVPSLCLFHHPAPPRYHLFWLTRHVDRIIFSSRFTADHTREITGKSGDVVYIGIDKERFARAVPRDHRLRTVLHVDNMTVVFAQIGALVPLKGHLILLDAFSLAIQQEPSIHLLIIGGGPERANIEARVSELKLSESVTLAGYVEDVAPYYKNVIDVNVLASVEEGFGLVNVQASFAGLPNIATDDTGIRETVVRDVTGFLFPSGDAAALSASMVRLARDADLRARMGGAGLAWAAERFTPAAFVNGMQDAMTEAATTRGAAA